MNASMGSSKEIKAAAVLKVYLYSLSPNTYFFNEMSLAFKINIKINKETYATHSDKKYPY